MRLFDRRAAAPDDVLPRAELPRGEKVLASARAGDGSWLLGTRRRLVVVPPAAGAAVHLLWEWLEDAAWDQDADRLTVTEVGAYGRPRPAYAFDLAAPGLLLQLVRERVTASIVLQQHVPVRGNRGVTVIGRRSPAGGPVAWMHAFDPGVDPADPEVAEVAAAALRRVQSEVGESDPDTI